MYFCGCLSGVIINELNTCNNWRCFTAQLTAGGNASIKCVAFGDPVPEVSWYKDARQLRNESVNLAVVDSRDLSDGRYVISHVLLPHVTYGDAGDYK